MIAVNQLRLLFAEDLNEVPQIEVKFYISTEDFKVSEDELNETVWDAMISMYFNPIRVHSARRIYSPTSLMLRE